MSGGVWADQGAHGAPVTGQKTVTTAGTRVQLTTTNTGTHTVVIRALLGNTAGAKIYVGGSNVSSSNGLELGPGDAVTIVTGNLANIYLDASTNTQSVSYLYT